MMGQVQSRVVGEKTGSSEEPKRTIESRLDRSKHTELAAH